MSLCLGKRLFTSELSDYGCYWYEMPVFLMHFKIFFPFRMNSGVYTKVRTFLILILSEKDSSGY